MKPLTLILLTLSIAAGACVPTFPTLAPTQTALPTRTQAPEKAVFLTPTPSPNALGDLEILGNVYIREIPNGTRIGALLLGEIVSGTCSGDWCEVPGGYIWRGCTDNNPRQKGCQTK